MRSNTCNILFTALTLTATFVAVSWGASQKRERQRLETNQSAFLEKERRYKLRDSLNAVSIGVLSLKTAEFAEHFSEMEALVKDMGVRLKRIEYISQNAQKSDYAITAPVRDTVVITDSTNVRKGLTLTYKSPWIELDGMILEDRFKGSVVTYDTLVQVVHRVPRRFLFFRFGTKELRQEIVSSNPNSRLTYSRTLKMVK